MIERETIIKEYEAIWDGNQWLPVDNVIDSLKQSNAPRKMMRLQFTKHEFNKITREYEPPMDEQDKAEYEDMIRQSRTPPNLNL
jgi:hypothetical protein